MIHPLEWALIIMVGALLFRKEIRARNKEIYKSTKELLKIYKKEKGFNIPWNRD